MANLLNGLSLAAIAEESLPVLHKRVPLLTAFNTDFSKETAAAFASIVTRYPNAVTASVYTRATGYVTQDASASQVQMTLGDVIHSVSAFTDYEISTITMPRLINTFLRGNMNAVIDAIYNQVTAPILYNNYGSASFTGSASSFGFNQYYGNVVAALKTAGVTSDYSVVLNSAYYASFLGDVKNTFVALNLADNFYQSGQLPKLGGATPLESPGLTNHGEGLVGFGCGKEALNIATRLPVIAVDNGIEEVETVEDSMTGLTLQLRLSRNPWTGLTYVGYYVLAGTAIGNTAALVRMTDGTRW